MVRSKNKSIGTGVLFFLILGFFCSCSKIPDGNEPVIIPGLANFTAAKIRGIYNIILIQDTVNMIIISGDEHLNSISARVTDDTLEVANRKNLSFRPGRNTLEIHFRNLEYLTTFDAVHVTNSDTLEAERFYYDALGEISEADLVVDCDYLFLCTSANTLGNIKLSGRAGYFSIFNRYGSSIIASDLKSREVFVTTQSIGNDYVNASDFLQAYIWGPGNIYYTGNPVTDVVERTGSGNLLRVN
jgi:hypothetical protein